MTTRTAATTTVPAGTGGSSTVVAVRHRAGTSGFLVALLVLGLVALLSVAVGARAIPLSTVVDSLFGRGSAEADYVVWSLRLPRTLLGIAVGAALGVAGALMQALTRNPLADPGLLGINSGAGAAVALAIGLFGVTTPLGYVWFGFAGAAVAGFAVYVLANGPNRTVASPVRLALSGMAVAAALTSTTQAVTLLGTKALDQMRFWTVGSLARASGEVLAMTGPLLAVGVVAGLLLARPLNAVALGDDSAAALGTKVGAVRLTGLAVVTLLCGAATAAVGPLVFVGLAVPHAARRFTGPDHRWLLPYCAVLSAALLLGADVIGRVIAGTELDVGVVTAVLGAPVFIALVRRGKP